MADADRAYAFIDGGYLRAGLEKIDIDWREINLYNMAYAVVEFSNANMPWLRHETKLRRVFVYDAVPDDVAEQSDVADWLSGNAALPDVHVQRGALVGRRRRQKAVDVQLAVDALTLASNGVYDMGLFLTGDADFVPVVEAVRFKGPLITVSAFADSLAPDLSEAADRVHVLPSEMMAVFWRTSRGLRPPGT